MSTAIGVSLPRLATAVGKAVSEYAVLGKTPGFTADFIKNKYPSYSSFASAITHSRSGNATMTDGYGPELVVNGDFSTGDLTGWTDNSTGSGSVSVVNNTLLLAGTDTSNRGFVTSDSFTTKPNVAYIIELSVTDRQGSGDLQLQFSDVGGNRLDEFPITAKGRYQYTVIAQRTASYLKINCYDDDSVSIDNVSVREMPVLKWAPHNLLKYSEDFSQSQWSKANATVSGQEVTVTTASATNVLYQILSTVAGQYRLEAEVKAGTTDALGLKLTDQGTASHTVTVDLTGETISAGTGTTTDRSIEDIGDGWYLIGFNVNIPAAGATDTVYFTEGATAFGSGDTFFARNVRLFRSDLGGMVDNPDQPLSRASYVPTTSSAKYLSRVGHHVYNGNAWVNEGLLAESEARTNSVLYSNDLSQTGWSKQQTTVTANSGISPDGTNNAWKLSETAVTGTHLLVVSVTATECCSIYAKAGTRSRFRINSGTSGNAFAEFNLADGTIYSGAGGTYYVDSTMEDVGNGWYRCSLAFSGSTSTSFTIAMENDTGSVSYAGDTSKHIFLYGGQSETGQATPSSYISTDSATVTRAAETFTIPSANLPWPSPNYIGSELIDSGTFDDASALDDWVTVGNVTASVSNGEVTISGDGGYNDGIQQIFNTTVGAVYSVTVTGRSITGNVTMRVRELGGSYTTLEAHTFTSTSNETVTLFFTAISAQSYVQLMQWSTSAGSGVFDNVSVREINPLSVSIAMDGRMTYADTGGATEVEFFEWQADGSNLIRAYVNTGGANTGVVYVQQKESGVTDSVNSLAETEFSPDVLVSYSIAGQMASTSLRAFVDGIDIGQNLTPTALADLSSSDLDLALDYMGTVRTFRVWDRSLTDDALAEATNPSLEPSLSLTFEGTGTNSFVVNDWSE